MKAIIIILFILSLAASIKPIDAYTFQAGHCDPGSLATQPLASGTHGNQGSGPLEANGIEITIDGDVLIPGLAMVLDTNRKYIVSLKRSTGNFRGLLFRLPVQGAFTIGTAYADLFQNHPNCDSSVSAVTHRSSVDKNAVEFTLEVTEDYIGDFTLDVTVVQSREFLDNWFYNQYYLKFVKSTTSSPSASVPSSAPSSEPSSAPSASASVSPSAAPSVSVSPSSAPSVSVSPSSAPVKTPSTSAPVKTPTTSAPVTSAPVKAPTTSAPFTSAPVVAPTPSKCVDSKLRMMIGGENLRRCGWATRNSKKKCARRNVAQHCPLACDGVKNSCQSYKCEDSTKKFQMRHSGRIITCNFVTKKPVRRCKRWGMKKTCRATCGFCNA